MDGYTFIVITGLVNRYISTNYNKMSPKQGFGIKVGSRSRKNIKYRTQTEFGKKSRKMEDRSWSRQQKSKKFRS